MHLEETKRKERRPLWRSIDIYRAARKCPVKQERQHNSNSIFIFNMSQLLQKKYETAYMKGSVFRCDAVCDKSSTLFISMFLNSFITSFCLYWLVWQVTQLCSMSKCKCAVSSCLFLISLSLSHSRVSEGSTGTGNDFFERFFTEWNDLKWQPQVVEFRK